MKHCSKQITIPLRKTPARSFSLARESDPLMRRDSTSNIPLTIRRYKLCPMQLRREHWYYARLNQDILTTAVISPVEPTDGSVPRQGIQLQCPQKLSQSPLQIEPDHLQLTHVGPHLSASRISTLKLAWQAGMLVQVRNPAEMCTKSLVIRRV